MPPRLIGEPVPRREDRRLLTGGGRFTDDVNAPGQAHAAFLRSPHAHAQIRRIDCAEAAALPGVLAVLTGRDYAADGHAPLLQFHTPVDHLDPTRPGLSGEELAPLPEPPPVAADRVRHVGEIVAVAVAETRDAALDALERIAVDYEPLPAVTDALAAAEPGAPRLWDGDNVCLHAEAGDAVACEAAFRAAHRTVRLSLHNHRIYGCPMEPKSALGKFDPGSGRYTLHAPSQGVHRFQRSIAAAFGVDRGCVRIVSGDVGGGYGVRSACGNEYPLLLWAARRSGRPVKWTASRSETFLSDYHARDIRTEGALALDADSRIAGLRIDYLGNVGAYPISFAVLSNLLKMAGPPYDIRAMHVTVRGAFTNTIPVSVYRGAGRPEVTQIVERLVDLAADEAGMDRSALRRRNLIAPAALPYRSGLGLDYDSGAFGENFEAVLRQIDWQGFPARREAAAARGRRAGIGAVAYLESPGAAPYERTDIAVRPDGRVEAAIGTQASGQGHETSFAQVVAETLEIPLDRVAIVFGDTDKAVDGSGSHADRSMRLGGTILLRASRRIVDEGREAAARLLEAAAADIGYGGGAVHRARHRPFDRAVRGRRRGAARGHRGDRDPAARAPQRRGGVRGRDRPRDRRACDRPLRHRRRCRPGHQPGDRRGPNPWRHRPGHRPGAVRTHRLRAGLGAAAVGLVHGLLPAARRRPARVLRAPERLPDGEQSARRQGRGRDRNHPGDGGGRERRHRRAPGVRGGASRNAAHPRAHLARDPGGGVSRTCPLYGDFGVKS